LREFSQNDHFFKSELVSGIRGLGRSSAADWTAIIEVEIGISLEPVTNRMSLKVN